MRRALLAAAVATLGAVPAAHASTATLTGSTLYITGNVAPTAITISQDGTDVVVTTAGLATDPDDAGTSCALPATGTARCTDASVASVSVNGGSGGDTITVDRATTDADEHLINGNGGGDTLTAAAQPGGTAVKVQLNGGFGDDTLTKNLPNARLDGGPNADRLFGGATSLVSDPFAPGDTGGEGDDALTGGDGAAGFSSFLAEPGADTYTGNPAPAFLVSSFGSTFPVGDKLSYELEPGPVTIDLATPGGDGAAGENDDVQATVDIVTGSQGADTVTCATAACFAYGDDGDDVMNGGPGGDFLSGDGGSDQLVGAAGDDLLIDGDFTAIDSTVALPPAGDDRLDGGPGDDTFEQDRGADDVSGGDGFDQLALQRYVRVAPPIPVTPGALAERGFAVSLDDVANDGAIGDDEGDDLHSDLEQVTTTGGDDVVSGSGNPDTLRTGAGRDTIDGRAGADTIEAGPGDDAVTVLDGFTDRADCGSGADAATADLPGEQPERADGLLSCETVGGTPFGPLVAPSPSPEPGDTAAPQMTIGKRAYRRGTLSIAVTCNEACSLTAEAYTTAAKVAAVGRLSVGRGQLAAGTGRRTLKVRLAKRFRKAAARRLRRRSLPFSVRLVATDAAGNRARRTVSVRAKRT